MSEEEIKKNPKTPDDSKPEEKANPEAEPKPEEKKEEAKPEEKESKKEKKDKYKEAISRLEAEKAELEKKYADLKNEYLKAYAELENTKKRIKDEAVKDRKYASQKVVGELVQPIDMLQMIVNMPAPSPEVQNYVIGFQMISNQLVEILKGEGLAPIEAKPGMTFDPKVMQAVETSWDESKPEHEILTVRQAGYMYKDRVLRPAMVIVNKKPEEKKEEAPVKETESAENKNEEKKEEK